jgi:RNA polymerase sigma-70 factor (ECF subfamily)
MSSESDRILVQTIRSGGGRADRAWEELVQRYEGRLRAYVRRRLRDHAATDDVVQETFIGFLHSLTNFDDKRDLQTWLFTIASHKVTDQLRKLGRRPYQAGSEADEEMLGQEPDGRQRAASSIARNKEREELEVEAVARSLREIIRGFQQKGEYRRVQVLELLFVKGWPNWQVAEFLAVSEQQVANYRFAAVKKLTEAIRSAGLPTDVFPELQGADPTA